MELVIRGCGKVSLRISKVEIRNFRSVYNLSLEPGRMAVLVGNNDSGKSNILRALNLFFNDTVGPGESLEFGVDHNIFNNPNRRAKEIVVKVEFELPPSYREKNGDIIVWEKRWRAGGVQYEELYGLWKIPGPKGGLKFKKNEKISKRSNARTLLQNIDFVYVPAIKDPNYFMILQGQIYEIISDIAGKVFRNSSRNFEQSISRQIRDLTAKISKSLGVDSRLALPKDLSHIFKQLDFLSEHQNISLDARGDGIKARHIPLILKFMADKRHGLREPNTQPLTTIWAYEEPENSLEFANCIKLADEFWSCINDGISQIFLTTHSPVFYNLHERETKEEGRVSCHHIYRDRDEDGTRETTNIRDLDDRMGTTAFFAPKMKKFEENVRAKEKARIEAAQIAKSNRRQIFVEGITDKYIIDKALKVFSPKHNKKVEVKTKEQGAGINFVEDMLSSWKGQVNQNSKLHKAAGILDQDPEARKALRKWNEASGNTKAAKCFKLPTPDHLKDALRNSINIPIVLESLYDKEAWEWAKNHRYLQKRSLARVLPEEVNNEILAKEL